VVGALAAGLLTGCAGGGTSITATFDDVGDLQHRGSVQVADVRIGEISKITLTKDFHARVRLHLNPGVRVSRDSTAYLRTTSLLGEKFIELRANAKPGAPPYFRNGDVIPRGRAVEAPELEFVADQAVTALGSVVASDVATLVDTGAEAFGDRGPVLRSLIGELSSISATLASRTDAIAHIVDGFDTTASALAAGKNDLDGLLVNLAQTTKILADNRQQAVTALTQLSRLAGVQNEVLAKYHADIDRQIKQVDAIVGVAAGQTNELSLLVDWLDRFTVAVPKVIPGDFTEVYAWVVPAQFDPRVGS
jgi:phospholipid/cholesterol/gamma-HCH transport system substrate-binding protein